jgi:hypothetical protein
MNNHIKEWQLGSESKLTSIERMYLHQEWLKIQHQDIKDKIHSKNKVEESPVVGFVKD